MDIKALLDLYAGIALTVFAVLVGFRVIRTAYLFATKSGIRGRNLKALDNPEFRGSALTVIGRASAFTRKSNPLYYWGLVLYHIDIISLSVMYALTAARMIAATNRADGILDVATGTIGSNYSLSNILAIVFGSGEPMQAEFLYGAYAGLYRSITWGLLVVAVIGNLLIILSRVTQSGGGAVVSDIDATAKGVRVRGINNRSHLLVSLLISGIIWSEIVARLGLFEGAVYYHSFLGVTVLLLVPFTYLIHTIYVPFYLYNAAKRYRMRYIG